MLFPRNNKTSFLGQLCQQGTEVLQGELRREGLPDEPLGREGGPRRHRPRQQIPEVLRGSGKVRLCKVIG